MKCKWVFWVVGYLWRVGAGRIEGVLGECGGLGVCVCRGLECWPWSWVGLNVSRKE